MKFFDFISRFFVISSNIHWILRFNSYQDNPEDKQKSSKKNKEQNNAIKEQQQPTKESKKKDTKKSK